VEAKMAAIRVVFWIMIVGLVVGCGAPSEAQQAYNACKKSVEEELVAPTTAKFPEVADVEIFRMGSGTLHVQGSVDSQNAMGVMVRLDFDCSMDENLENVEARVMGR
jgi:hypothetical protein